MQSVQRIDSFLPRGLFPPFWPLKRAYPLPAFGKVGVFKRGWNGTYKRILGRSRKSYGRNSRGIPISVEKMDGTYSVDWCAAVSARRYQRMGGEMKYTLKPCPFCGGEAILDLDKNGLPFHYYIYCRMCFIQTDSFEKDTEAVNYWNTRATN